MGLPQFTPAQVRPLLVKGAGLLGVVLWMGLVVLPQQRALAVASANVRARRAELAEVRRGVAQLSALQAEAAALGRQYRVPSRIPPAEEQLPEVLKVIAEIAKGSQVSLRTAKPKAEVGPRPPSAGGYLEVPVEIAALGGYHEIGTFLDGLEQSPLLFRVERLGIQPDPGDLWHHQATLWLRVYVMTPATSKPS